MTTFYSIKYLETKGIDSFEGDVFECEYGCAGHLGTVSGRFERIGVDCFLTQEEAVEGAKAKAKRRLLSAQRKVIKCVELVDRLSAQEK